MNLARFCVAKEWCGSNKNLLIINFLSVVKFCQNVLVTYDQKSGKQCRNGLMIGKLVNVNVNTFNGNHTTYSPSYFQKHELYHKLP